MRPRSIQPLYTRHSLYWAEGAEGIFTARLMVLCVTTFFTNFFTTFFAAGLCTTDFTTFFVTFLTM